MRPTRTALAAGAVAAALVAAIAVGAPATHRTSPTGARPQAATAEAQLLAALQTRISAARTLESATLAAVEQRLRAIYAQQIEDPLIALLAGDIQQAEALGELEAAMTRSDEALLSEYTNALTNLQTAQAELDQNMLRLTAARRIAAARRAARAAGAGTAAPAQLPAAPSAPGGGLPAGVAGQHSLPGAIPIDPRTGRPYPIAGA
jgi:hypothetical protein